MGVSEEPNERNLEDNRLKINKRKKDGKDSDVYYGKELISPKRLRKEISRHDITTLEKLHWIQGSRDPALLIS
jgi:hypothetical protein